MLATLGAEQAAVVRSLQAAGVAFVAVGGFAVRAHGHGRPAADLDLLFLPTDENRTAIAQALALWKAIDWTEEPGDAWVRLPPPLSVDLVPRIPGPSARVAITEAVPIEVGDLLVPTLSLDHSLMNKRHAGRPEDLTDIQALEAI